jgi:hypothetical protein
VSALSHSPVLSSPTLDDARRSESVSLLIQTERDTPKAAQGQNGQL